MNCQFCGMLLVMLRNSALTKRRGCIPKTKVDVLTRYNETTYDIPYCQPIIPCPNTMSFSTELCMCYCPKVWLITLKNRQTRPRLRTIVNFVLNSNSVNYDDPFRSLCLLAVSPLSLPPVTTTSTSPVLPPLFSVVPHICARSR